MANPYKDEAGHYTNKENDGGPCRHKRINGGKYESSEDGGKSWKEISRDEYDKLDAQKFNFDDTNDDDFGLFDDDNHLPEDEYGYGQTHNFLVDKNKEMQENGFKIYEDKIREDLAKVKNKSDAEYVSDLIDNNMEAGYISEELADELYNELDKKIDEFSNKEYFPEREDLRKNLQYRLDKEGLTSDIRIKANELGFKIENGEVVEDFEEQARADRATRSDEPISPMDEFSGPDREGPSYAQLDAMKTDEQNISDFENQLKNIGIKSVNKNNNNLFLTDDEKFRISSPSDKQLRDWKQKLENAGYNVEAEYMGGGGSSLIISPKTGNEMNNEPEEKLSYQPKYKAEDFEDARFYPTESTISAADVDKDPNMTLNYYVKEKFSDISVADFLKANGLENSGLKGTDSIADVHAAILSGEFKNVADKEMKKIEEDKIRVLKDDLREKLTSLGFRSTLNMDKEKLTKLNSKVDEIRKLLEEKKYKEAFELKNEIEEML